MEAFEAVARHLSVSRAAEELGVTQSAVSHQMRSLAEEIGERLFVIVGRKMVLTDPGQRLAERVRAAFSQIDRSVSDIVGTNRNILRLAVCTSFAPGWLVKRLDSFYMANPDIQLQVCMYAKDPELTDRVADAFVTTLPEELGFWSMPLRRELLVPVYASSRTDRVPGRLPLITTTLDPRRIGDDWLAYCELSGQPVESLHTGVWLQVSHYVTACDLARNGAGIALVPDFLAEDDVSAGRLVTLSPVKMPTKEDYYLCAKLSRRDEPGLRALIKWFRVQIATT